MNIQQVETANELKYKIENSKRILESLSSKSNKDMIWYYINNLSLSIQDEIREIIKRDLQNTIILSEIHLSQI